MAKNDGRLPERRVSSVEVEAFLRRVAEIAPVSSGTGRDKGRLLFSMDATASREPTWDHAARIQGEMFRETAALGGLEVQLCFYRGFGEFKVSHWVAEAERLTALMTAVDCLAGETQIGKVLAHAANETRKQKVNALVFVGDSCEEDVDALGVRAGELGILGVPAFMFHEGSDPLAAFAFGEVAKLTRGAYCRFDADAANTLRDLLRAVAVYAAGGRSALEDLAGRRGGEVLAIAHQMKR